MVLPRRQKKVLNIFLDGKEAKLTAQNGSRLGAVSLDTALRDIDDLVKKGALSAYPGKTRKIEYAINYVKADDFLEHFRNILAAYDGTEVRERISDLGYTQFESGKMSSSDLVHKYMAYLFP